jgi:hypothetical protein
MGERPMTTRRLALLRASALTMSLLVACLTLGNLLTLATRGITVTLPEPDDIHWSIDPQGQNILLHTTFSIHNHGVYHITNINSDIKLLNQYNHTLITYQTHDLASTRGSDSIFDILIPLHIDRISLFDWISLVYSHTSLRLVINADAQYMFDLLQFSMHETITIPSPTTSLEALLNNTAVKTGITGLTTLAGLLADGRLPNLTALADLLTLPPVSYVTETGWGFTLTIHNITNTLKQYTFTITTPVPFQTGSFVFTAILRFGLDENTTPVLTLETMRIAYDN